uniref:GDSL esterase/lipase At1g29660-like n=1 Tax=Erigeron canadensis TaxID=72917 RepID=UPI001CB91849|nr:GDSL esterase/lipase At1g29660-like [Erigeron canadensis]
MAHGFGRRLVSGLICMVLIYLRAFVASFEPQVPCYFIFGDSWVDSGNNNQLVTKAKVNYPPYGVDFPEGSTGRFTNGRTIADIIGQFLGFNKFIPSYASVRDKVITTGVNYGSGSAGIREESGSVMGDRISLDKQLLHHKSIISRLPRWKRKSRFLQQCIYIVNMGSNDYSNNFFFPGVYNTSSIYTDEQYAEVLIQQYSQQLKTLYKLGGRKIVVFSLALLGCSPVYIARFGTKGKPCVEPVNNAVKLFNRRLLSLIRELNSNYSHARFTFINLESILSPVGDVPMSHEPCCELKNEWQCIPNSAPCPVREFSFFFDGFHPAEISNMIIATRAYTAFSPTDAHPYDISHLAQL